jgi:hypothetical protein
MVVVENIQAGGVWSGGGPQYYGSRWTKQCGLCECTPCRRYRKGDPSVYLVQAWSRTGAARLRHIVEFDAINKLELAEGIMGGIP